MKLVITDGYTLNPGDLSWKLFEELGEVALYDRTAQSEVVDRCKDATAILTNKTPVTEDVIRKAKQLKVIAVTATGYNIVDVAAARDAGVPVCNVPGYGTNSVAQHTIAFLLELANHVGLNARSVADGEWSASKDFSYTKKPIVEIYGKTLGIVGYGSIGRKVAEIAKAFGMKVLSYSPSATGNEPGAVSMEAVFSQSDFVSLHCPLTRENAGFVNSGLLATMKPTACLINTARGQLINENDLRAALLNNALAGAALDVLSAEPPPPDHPLIGLPNCIITPHNAWCSFEARQRIMQTSYENVVAALRGTPQHVVNQAPS